MSCYAKKKGKRQGTNRKRMLAELSLAELRRLAMTHGADTEEGQEIRREIARRGAREAVPVFVEPRKADR